METGKNLSPKVYDICVPPFEPKHILYMILCLAEAALALLFFFWRDLNLSLRRFHDEPAGILIRKRNIAQRHFADRTLWDRLRRDLSAPLLG
jgi:hypothetical protein